MFGKKHDLAIFHIDWTLSVFNFIRVTYTLNVKEILQIMIR